MKRIIKKVLRVHKIQQNQNQIYYHYYPKFIIQTKHYYPKPSQGLIPTDRLNRDLPFSMIATDYPEPFMCNIKRKIANFIYCCQSVA